jgi:hypothetical protein
VSTFSGEHRTAPEHALPQNVSPDALNCDYLDGLLRKRPGWYRLHKTPLLSGGGLTGNQPVARYTANWVMTDSTFELELAVVPMWPAAPAVGSGARVYLLSNYQSGPDRGLRAGLVENGAGAWTWFFRLYHDGPGHVEIIDAAPVVEGQTYTLRFRYETGNRIGFATGAGWTWAALPGGTTWSAPSVSLSIGPGSFSTSDPRIYFIVDDFRHWLTNSRQRLCDFLEELLESDVTDWVVLGDLLCYFKFPGTATPGYTFTGNANVLSTRGLVFGPANFARVTGVFSVPDGAVEDRAIVCTESSLYVLTYATGALEHLYTATVSSSNRWTAQLFNGWLILTNGANENLKYHPSHGLFPLSYTAPSVSAAITITQAAGAGTFSATGLVQYLFTFVDSVRQQETAYGAFTTEINLAVVTNEITLGAVNPLPMTYQNGIDTLRVYRTEPGGTVFYRFKDLAIGTASYTDDDTDDGGGPGDGFCDPTSPLYPYHGYAEPSLFSFVFNDTVFCANQAGHESRIVFSEPGAYGDFYYDNYFFAGRDDGDSLTGAADVGGVVLLFKTRSIWVLVGDGPGTYTARRLYGNVGCVSQATVSTFSEGVFFQGVNGIYLMPLPLGAGPPRDVSESSQRMLFQSVTAKERLNCCGLFDPTSYRYFCVYQGGGILQTIALDVLKGTWALWDLAPGAFASVMRDGGAQQVVVGMDGFVGVLDSACLNDGAAFARSPNYALSGVATGGSTTTLIDAHAAFVFPTDERGIAGATVRIHHQAGGVSTVRIWKNGWQELYLSEAVTPAVQAGDSYMIGPIASRWRGPKNSLDGDPAEEKAIERLRMLFEGGDAELIVRVHTEQGSEQHYLDASERVSEREVHVRGREGWIEIEHDSPDEAFEVAAWQLTFQQRKARP